MITREILISDNVVFLQDETALYACDFRALGNTSAAAVPWLWSYENLLPWILEDKFATANELASNLKYDSSSRILVLERGEDSRVSIFEKIPPDFISENNIKSLWVPVAHPQADLLAQRHDLKLNFKYSDLREYNNKLSQKKLLGQYTPSWQEIGSSDDVLKIKEGGGRGFIKHSFGAAGNRVFNIDAANGQPGDDLSQAFAKNPEGWFFEELAEGVPYSIQCLSYRDQDTIIVFGFTQQLIAEGKRFIGSQILTLDDLDSNLRGQLEGALKNLNPIIKNYEGFWGLDFIIHPSGKILILEANIRMTAATVPTLLASKYGWVKPHYLEDIAKNDIKDGDVILTEDIFSGTADVLRKKD